VFGLGALSYLILTGQPPADSRAALAQRLAAERALTPAAEGLTAVMDRLIRGATAVQPADRTESVRDLLAELDDVEDELTAPEPAEEPDPLTAGKGTVVGSWIVERVLGKGSTARALLVARAGEWQVLKVALSASAAQRLTWEAATLRKLTDSRIVRLIDGPFEVAGRTVIALDGAGERTLADEIREQGPLSIGELEKLGEDLLHAVLYLEEEKVWHRDIKPDNLALREVPRRAAAWSCSTSRWPASRTARSAWAPRSTSTRSSACSLTRPSTRPVLRSPRPTAVPYRERRPVAARSGRAERRWQRARRTAVSF
jgi:hypothetical protein